MKKFKNIFLVLCLIAMIAIPGLVHADVGDFESYGSDWGSSSFDFDWESSSDYGSYGGSYDIDDISDDDDWGGIILIIIIFVIIGSIKGKGGNRVGNANNYRPQNNYVRSSVRSEAVANEIREVDKYFNDEKFISYAKNLFVKLQNAWSARDWETIRPLESESLFEQHSTQLQGYITRKQINKIERICVNFAELVSFSQDNEKDILIVALNSSMIDYIIDEDSGNVIKGNKENRITNTYKLTFTRKRGVVTAEGTNEAGTTNCPNCGAPTKVTSSGKCEYCGSVITMGAHDWVLNDMERF